MTDISSKAPITLLLNTNKSDNPYIRMHMMLDTLENAPKDWAVDKVWLRKELEYIFGYFFTLAEEEYKCDM
jgi:hypothetical protein